MNQSAHETLIPLLCELIGAQTYLELGVHRGDCLLKVAKWVPGITVVGVDKENLILTLPSNVTFIHSDTLSYLKTLNGPVFDVVFIDADHSADAVIQDVIHVLPHVNEHGLILLHDTFPVDITYTDPGYCGDSYKVPEQLTANCPDIEFVTLPYHPGLTVIRKRSKQVFW